MLWRITALLTMSVFTLAGSVAMAEPETETIVKYRQGVMTSMRGHTSASARIIFEGYEAPVHLKVHAAAIAGVTNDIPALFPEGSTNEESEALSSVWEEWEKFEEAARKNRSAAQAFAQAVDDGADEQTLAARFEELLDSCRGCHDDFREEHDD